MIEPAQRHIPIWPERGIAMNDVMMQLGGDDGFQFSVATAAYDSLRRSTAYRWQGQDRPRGLPVQQYMGLGADSINLAGTILPHFKGGLGQIARMRELAGRGEPLRLVAMQASGVHATCAWDLGLWCITAIEETQTQFTAFGAPLQIQFDLSLIAYGGDDAISHA